MKKLPYSSPDLSSANPAKIHFVLFALRALEVWAQFGLASAGSLVRLSFTAIGQSVSSTDIHTGQHRKKEKNPDPSSLQLRQNQGFDLPSAINTPPWEPMLRANKMTGDEIVQALEENRSLKHLDISGSCYRIKENSMVAICERLAQQRSLTRLCLGSINSKVGCEAVGNMLRDTTTLCRLDLLEDQSFNAVSFFPDVIASIGHNNSVQYLEVKMYEYNHDQYRNMIASLQRSLRTNTSLTEFHIMYGTLHDDDPTDPARYICRTVLGLCRVLQEFPRYHRLRMYGVCCSAVAEDLGVPLRANEDKCEDEDEWEDEDEDQKVVEYIQNMHRQQVLAFAMGKHRRLGNASCVQQLSHKCLKLIVSSFFRLPHDYFGC